jgi:NADH:quinone reductase (non-electrogenic)
MSPATQAPGRVVIVGGGFGGLYAARVLAAAGASVTVVDRRNFHLFQPLLYQVATGGLSPGDIASPIRSVLRRHRNARVLLGEAVDIDPARGRVRIADGDDLAYDRLVVATGSETSYFGHEAWLPHAPGLKTVEDALHIRQRVFAAFERAERESDEAARRALTTFAVVGGGPTGVELAGAIAELARSTLARDYRAFDPTRARVILLEGGERVLPVFPAELSHHATRSLARLGVEVRTRTFVTAIADGVLTVRADERDESIRAATVLWAAGVRASPFANRLVERFGARRDPSGRVEVTADLSLPGHPEVFVIGDLALAAGRSGRPLPALAPVAMQQGRFVARRILGREPAGAAFRYHDKGQLAVIGRNAAVCDLGRARFSGFPAWLVWVFVHIAYLIEYDNKVLVLVQWAMSYVTRKRGARLITNPAIE